MTKGLQIGLQRPLIQPLQHGLNPQLGGDRAPSGYVYIVNRDGAYLISRDGAKLMRPA